MEGTRRTSGLVTLDGVLLDDDLDAIARAHEALVFVDQDLGRGHLRRRQRADLDSTVLASRLWARIEPHVSEPETWFDAERPPPDLHPPIGQWSWAGLNPRMRFYRYELGAEFAEHVDEPWRPTEDRRTLLTVLAYLPCGGCEGGETIVGDETVAAVEGRVVIFDHRTPHRGRPVERGKKLVLRSDVLAAVDR